MKTLDFSGPVEDYHTTGVYFCPKSHICKHYLIRFDVKSEGHRCIVSIFEIGIPQHSGDVMLVENGEDVAVTEAEEVFRIDLCGKYYFPEFVSRQYQWYYNDRSGVVPYRYDEDGNMDEVMAMAEVMKFAIRKGLEAGNITPY